MADALAIVSDVTHTYGLEHRFHTSGIDDTPVRGEVAAHMLSTLREALSNVGRHAQAERVDVSIVAGRPRLSSSALTRSGSNGVMPKEM